MKDPSISSRLLLAKCCLIGLIWNCLSLSGAVFAQTTPKPAGELASARQVRINDADASAGQTVFSESRIKTGNHGLAVINLGKYGRVEMGPETELVLRFSEKSVGGELVYGCLMVNTPANVEALIRTTEGIVASNIAQPASLRIGRKQEQNQEVMHVISDLGEATVASAHKSEYLKTGQYLTVTTKSGNQVFSRLGESRDCGLRRSAGEELSCACRPAGLAKGSGKLGLGVGGVSVAAILLLGSAGVIATAVSSSSSGSGGITCVDTLGFNCASVSLSRP